MKWTPEKDAELLRRVQAGESFELIAAVLKCRTPNVIGRLKDLKVLDGNKGKEFRLDEVRSTNLVLPRKPWR